MAPPDRRSRAPSFYGRSESPALLPQALANRERRARETQTQHNLSLEWQKARDRRDQEKRDQEKRDEEEQDRRDREKWAQEKRALQQRAREKKSQEEQAQAQESQVHASNYPSGARDAVG